jgi:hypothetical protein
MTWRDKLELGLKEDAAYRRDNLPASQIRDPEVPTGPGRSPEIPLAHGGPDLRCPTEPIARPAPSKLAGPLDCGPVQRSVRRNQALKVKH